MAKLEMTYSYNRNEDGTITEVRTVDGEETFRSTYPMSECIYKGSWEWSNVNNSNTGNEIHG